MCHTEASRIPSDANLPLNSASVHRTDCPMPGVTDHREHMKTLIAGQQYYRYLYVPDFHLWAQNQWFNELSLTALRLGIEKVIHLHSFPTSLKKSDPYIFDFGMTIEEPLTYLTTVFNKKNKLRFRINCGEEPHPNSSFFNHYTIEENKRLAEYLFNVINNYSNGLKSLDIPGIDLDQLHDIWLDTYD